ncbi:MAG: hypothetical protein ACRDL0_14495, partial [Thermoleophilaceae bacterium]
MLVGGLVALTVGGGEQSSPRAVGADTSAAAAPGTPARFAYLARQRSNRCELQAGELLRRHTRGRLQGSCWLICPTQPGTICYTVSLMRTIDRRHGALGAAALAVRAIVACGE